MQSVKFLFKGRAVSAQDNPKSYKLRQELLEIGLNIEMIKAEKLLQRWQACKSTWLVVSPAQFCMFLFTRNRLGMKNDFKELRVSFPKLETEAEPITVRLIR